jgi:hypothetical protein
MDILDKKSEAILSFFTGMDELLDLMNQALKSRTPHLNGEKFLTNRDVCAMLHVSARTLQDWKTKGKIPYIQLKSKVLYWQSDIDKFLQNNYFPANK